MVCGKPHCKDRHIISKTNLWVYLCHVLYTLGDRMWFFSIGLFLINISPSSLQFTALSGLSQGFSVLFFGALIGDIVDMTARLKAAQIAIVLQNIFVVLNCTVIYIYLVYKEELLDAGSWIEYAVYILIVLFSVLYQLANLGRRLAVERDWVVEICQGDTDKLATMTAVLRRIDLSMKVIAPLAAGAMMTFGGIQTGALLLGGRSIISVVIEYYLLWKIYNTVPALREVKHFKRSHKATSPEERNKLVGSKEQEEVTKKQTTEAGSEAESEESENKAIADTEKDDTSRSELVREKSSMKCDRPLELFKKLYKGWPLYVKYDVFHAGIALSFTYLTVLGFDNITTGYAKMQGLSEGILGILMSISSLVGIIATFAYTFLRKRIGLDKTSSLGFITRLAALVLCIIAIFLPDSPFEFSKAFSSSNQIAPKNCSITTVTPNATIFHNQTGLSNISTTITNDSGNLTNDCKDTAGNDGGPTLSIWVFMLGIVAARFGLWLADLGVTQLLLEQVEEHERGKVNGVQDSLNQLMDMLKFLMVVLIPYSHQFGLLAIGSFVCLFIGWMFHLSYERKHRHQMRGRRRDRDGQGDESLSMEAAVA